MAQVPIIGPAPQLLEDEFGGSNANVGEAGDANVGASNAIVGANTEAPDGDAGSNVDVPTLEEIKNTEEGDTQEESKDPPLSDDEDAFSSGGEKDKSSLQGGGEDDENSSIGNDDILDDGLYSTLAKFFKTSEGKEKNVSDILLEISDTLKKLLLSDSSSQN